MPDTTLPDAGAGPDDQSVQDENEGLIPAQVDSLRVGGHAPEEGDTVQVKLEGIVDHVDPDGTAWIEPTKVNGQDIPTPPEDEESQSGNGQTESGLFKKAAQLDSGGGGY